MFNKNIFKDQFREWVENNSGASYEEAKKTCESLIPLELNEKYSWLLEHSLSWFLWRKENNNIKEDVQKNKLTDII
jgi:hypothetical protein